MEAEIVLNNVQQKLLDILVEKLLVVLHVENVMKLALMMLYLKIIMVDML